MGDEVNEANSTDVRRRKPKGGNSTLDLNATFQRGLTELQVMLEGVFEPGHPKGLGLPGVIAASGITDPPTAVRRRFCLSSK